MLLWCHIALHVNVLFRSHHIAKDGIRWCSRRRWHHCSPGCMQRYKLYNHTGSNEYIKYYDHYDYDYYKCINYTTMVLGHHSLQFIMTFCSFHCLCVLLSRRLLRPQGLLRQGRSDQQDCWWSQEGFRHHWSGQEWLHWGGWTEVMRNDFHYFCRFFKESSILAVTVHNNINTECNNALSTDCSCRTSNQARGHSLTPRPRLSSRLETPTVTARLELMVNALKLWLLCILWSF